jgi:hypothetical protein
MRRIKKKNEIKEEVFEFEKRKRRFIIIYLLFLLLLDLFNKQSVYDCIENNTENIESQDFDKYIKPALIMKT